MPKYRKKPIVVDAEQYFDPHKPVRGVNVNLIGEAYVVTIHGQCAYLSPGDWVIQEPDGEHYYPCKPDIFENTYEFVE